MITADTTFIHKILTLWGLEGAEVSFIAARENTVYRIDHQAGVFALRLHRPGYRSDRELTAELDWMAWAAQSGLSVPDPQPSREGRYLHHVAHTQVDLLRWLSGITLEAALDAETTPVEALFYRLGRDMARLHTASLAWPDAADCARPSWDADGLLGAAPLWDRFWENPALTTAERDCLCQFRGHASDALTAIAPRLDYGLIHADLVAANVLVDGARLHFIDFDDGGFGFHLFDVATALLKHHGRADYAEIEAALIAGYRSERPLETTHLALFMALRAMTYVGWNITRMTEDGATERNARFIHRALFWADRVLGAG